MKRLVIILPRVLASAIVAMLVTGSEIRAQAIAPSSAPASAQATVVLNPFLVEEGTEKGYAATNTLDGSRLNTALKDTPSPISVFTRDFLDDIAATDLTSMLRYDVNNDSEMSDGNSAGTGSEVGTFDRATRGSVWRTRGLFGGASLNGFVNSGASSSDLYNVERAGSGRGPNAILFGTGAPGGMINLTTKAAQTRKNATILEFKAGDNSTRRASFDTNYVLRKDHLALRLMGVYDDKGSYIPNVYTRKKGATIAGQYRFSQNTGVRLSYDELHTEGVGGRPWGPQDSITAFLNALDSGAVRFDPVDGRYETANGAVVAASSGVGTLAARTVLVYDPVRGTGAPILWEGASATTNRNTLSSTASQFTGAKPGIPESLAPYGSVSATGAGEYGEINRSTFNATFDHQWFRNFNMELTYNLAKQHPKSTIGGNPELRADLNYRLPDGSLNPYFFGNGYYFEQQAWVRVVRELRDETMRAAFSYEHDFGKFGFHRLAVLGERYNNHNVRYREREAWEGAPYGGAAEGAANQVFRRKYFKIDGPRSEWGIGYNPDRFGSDSYTSSFASVGTLRSVWVPANGLDIDDDVNTDSLFAVMQNYFFNRRLVTTAGVRQDKIHIYSPRTLRDPRNGRFRFATSADQPTFERQGQSWFDTVDLAGDRLSLGAVLHINENFSFTANTSDGVQLPERNRSVLPNERPADPYPGESRDAGMNFSFFGNRLAGSLRFYESAMRREPSNDNVQAVFGDPNNDIMTSFDYYYRQAGLTNLGSGAPIASIDDLRTIYLSDADAYLSDTESRGFEFEVTANPTRNWSIRAAYANTRSTRTNILSEGEPWWAERLVLWQNLDTFYMARTGRPSVYNQLLVDQTNAVTQRTVRDRIGDSATELADLREVEGHGFGSRRHKISLWNRYNFSQGMLRGAAVGGGYVYQSGNLAGYDVRTGREFYGNARSTFDLLLQYRTKGLFGLARDRVGVTYQLNVTNVFDADTILSTKMLVDAATGQLYNRRAFRETPRSYLFTLRFDL